ncbi:phosphohydrolase [Melioribacter sp. Ez-97]|uniref:phosphohydrolase n=1 Tax=Melioribacter sp. Ez-97 TaxID=3423434 RepID=UPI003EDADC6F
MEKEKLLNEAMLIAQEAHRNQTDKNGVPYFGHLFRVMNMGTTLDEKICGVLHDLMEDTGWTEFDLEAKGFPSYIIDALKALTKKEGESYDEFIDRVSKNKLAAKVKINDLTDNLDIKRYIVLTEKDLERLKKYHKAYRKLILQ